MQNTQGFHDFFTRILSHIGWILFLYAYSIRISLNIILSLNASPHNAPFSIYCLNQKLCELVNLQTNVSTKFFFSNLVTIKWTCFIQAKKARHPYQNVCPGIHKNQNISISFFVPFSMIAKYIGPFTF